MDLKKHSPSNGRLPGTFSTVLQQGNETKKSTNPEKLTPDILKKLRISSSDSESKKLQEIAFLGQLFAGISTVKAAYAQMQSAQSPYDSDGIQSADQTIVLELKNMSQLKESYLKKEASDVPLETTLLKSEIQEQKSLLTIYEITGKKLDSQLKLKDAEISSLKEKLTEAERDNKAREKKINASAPLVELDNVQLSSLQPSHFIANFRQTIKSVRSFVRLMIGQMESAGWSLDAAAAAIKPGVCFWKPNHKCYAIESFVCEKMYDGFNSPNISARAIDRECLRHNFFEGFRELKSVKPVDYLSWKPKSPFAMFCRTKYLRLMHPKMEASLFGNLNMRNSVDSMHFPADTPFFSAFSEMAKRVWLLHCLAVSFDPTVGIFQAGKGNRFSEVYMESLSDEAFLKGDGEPRVAFTVVPGFRMGATVIQCQVYLCC